MIKLKSLLFENSKPRFGDYGAYYVKFRVVTSGGGQKVMSKKLTLNKIKGHRLYFSAVKNTTKSVFLLDIDDIIEVKERTNKIVKVKNPHGGTYDDTKTIWKPVNFKKWVK